MPGQKKNLRYSEETLGFPEYYIGWIGIGNYGQKTSIIQPPPVRARLRKISISVKQF